MDTLGTLARSAIWYALSPVFFMYAIICLLGSVSFMGGIYDAFMRLSSRKMNNSYLLTFPCTIQDLRPLRSALSWCLRLSTREIACFRWTKEVYQGVGRKSRGICAADGSLFPLPFSLSGSSLRKGKFRPETCTFFRAKSATWLTNERRIRQCKSGEGRTWLSDT